MTEDPMKELLAKLIKDKKLQAEENEWVPKILIYKVIQDIEEEIACLVENTDSSALLTTARANAAIEAYSDSINKIKDILGE